MHRLINQRADLSVKFAAKLFWVISIMEGDCHVYAKNGSDLQLIANHPVFQFETEFFQTLKKGEVVFRPHRRFFDAAMLFKNYEDHQLTAASQFISSLL